MSSVHAQVGNRDNALMRRKFGSGWRFQVGEGQGRLPNHVVTVFSALGAVIGYAFGRRRIAVAAGCCWSALVGEFAARRFLDGPRTLREAAGLVLTSVLIPPVAVWHRLVGEWLHRHANPEPVLAVLLDRDDTLIEDGPFLNDPNGVRPLPGVPAALSRLRDRGLLIGVVTNQSGVARGLITMPQLAAVNSAVEAVIGPFDDWQVCVHGETDGCRCRKPQPGMVLAAAAELGVPPHRCVMIGDTGGDVKAARAAKAQAILIPTRRTRSAEVHDALLSPHMRVAANLGDAVDLVLKEAR
jgi:histidinol-phosphate phosphatase family protein